LGENAFVSTLNAGYVERNIGELQTESGKQVSMLALATFNLRFIPAS